jgi:hypothetical protein
MDRAFCLTDIPDSIAIGLAVLLLIFIIWSWFPIANGVKYKFVPETPLLIGPGGRIINKTGKTDTFIQGRYLPKQTASDDMNGFIQGRYLPKQTASDDMNSFVTTASSVNGGLVDPVLAKRSQKNINDAAFITGAPTIGSGGRIVGMEDSTHLRPIVSPSSGALQNSGTSAFTGNPYSDKQDDYYNGMY